jgi:hypothetical protein
MPAVRGQEQLSLIVETTTYESAAVAALGMRSGRQIYQRVVDLPGRVGDDSFAGDRAGGKQTVLAFRQGRVVVHVSQASVSRLHASLYDVSTMSARLTPAAREMARRVMG